MGILSCARIKLTSSSYHAQRNVMHYAFIRYHEDPSAELFTRRHRSIRAILTESESACFKRRFLRFPNQTPSIRVEAGLLDMSAFPSPLIEQIEAKVCCMWRCVQVK